MQTVAIAERGSLREMCHIWKTEYPRPLTSLNFIPFQNKHHNTQQPTTSPRLPNIHRRTVQRLVRWYTGIRYATGCTRKRCIWWPPSHPGNYFKHVKFKKRRERNKRISLKTPIKIGSQPSCNQTIPLTLIVTWPIQDCNSPSSEPYINQADNCFYTRLFTAIPLQNQPLVFSWHYIHKSTYNSLVFKLRTKLY